MGRGCSVPLHSALVAMGGKSLVCMTGFQGAIAFLFRFLPQLLHELEGYNKSRAYI